jgi:hypothetical protein
MLTVTFVTCGILNGYIVCCYAERRYAEWYDVFSVAV